MRRVRGALAEQSGLDTSRIVGALPRPRAYPVRPFRTWRVAAAIAVVSVGGLTVLTSRRAPREATGPAAGAGATTVAPLARRGPDGPDRHPARASAPAVAIAGRPAISFGGGVSDLSAADVEALLADVDRLDATPLAEPEPAAPIAPGVEGGR